MKINYGLFNEKEGSVIAWHEDTTQKGNYVLTVRTPMGATIPAIEKRLTPEQINELVEKVPKDETGL